MPLGRLHSVAQRLGRAFARLGALVAAVFVTTALSYAISWNWIAPELDKSRLTGEAETSAYSAMRDEDDALRAYARTGETALLEPYNRANAALLRANDDLVAHAGSSSLFAAAMMSTRVAEEKWRERWARDVAELSPDGIAPPLERGKELFDAYRREHVAFADVIAHRTETLAGRLRGATQVFVASELAGLLVVFVFGNRERHALRDAIVTPLAALIRDVARVRDGNLDATISHEGPREIHDLAKVLNDMLRRLAASRAADESHGVLVREHSTRLRQILDASREFSESLNLAYVVGAVRANTAAVGGYERVIVWLVDDGQTSLLDSERMGLAPRPADAAIEMGVGLAGRAAKSGRITLEGAEGRVRFSDSNNGTVRAMAIPLIVGARVIGVLEARHAEPQLATSRAVEVLEMFAAHAASAIEAARLHELTEERSQVDPLTKLFNRRRLEEDFDAECKRCLRYSHPLAFVMLDVDHFKAFNDTHGHPEADVALKEVAKVILSAMRTTDTAYRYGGEEFCILLRETGGKDAMIFAERLRKRIEHRFASGSQAGLTASFGVAEFSQDLPTPREVVGAADAAMYESKHTGRNRVMLSSTPPAATSAQTEVEGEIEPHLSS